MKMDDNYLDNLLRDKLKDLKVSPPKDTWETIAKKLPNKKKNRTVILWWSAAAVMLALLTSGVFYWSVTNTNNPKVQLVDASMENVKTSTKKNEKNTITIKDKQTETTDTLPSKDTDENQKYKTSTKLDISVNQAVADKNSSDETTALQVRKESKNTSIASDTKHFSKNKEIKQKEKETSLAKQGEPTDKENAKGKEKYNVATFQQIAHTKPSDNKEKETEKLQKMQSLIEESNPFATEEEPKNSEVKQDGKWSVGPQIAPVYYNSLNGRSSLDSQFNDSSKEGGINMSMGLQVAYQLNENWQFRSGINKVNVGYATNNVHVGYSDPNLAIVNINYANVPDGNVVVTAFSDDNLSSIQASEHGNRIEVMYLEGNTQLRQAISYLEVPIEIERKIINSDFEWSIIGGVSSLLLTHNDVYVTNEAFTSNIGSASNLEKVSFTTNIGMGFGYNLTKSLHFQLDPMFKYQLNAYSNSVNFKPYILGVYTGIRWKLD